MRLLPLLLSSVLALAIVAPPAAAIPTDSFMQVEELIAEAGALAGKRRPPSHEDVYVWKLAEATTGAMEKAGKSCEGERDLDESCLAAGISKKMMGQPKIGEALMAHWGLTDKETKARLKEIADNPKPGDAADMLTGILIGLLQASKGEDLTTPLEDALKIVSSWDDFDE